MIRNRKNTIALLLAIVITVTFSACSNSSASAQTSSIDENSVQDSQSVQGSAEEINEMTTNITMTFGDTVVTATLDDSETTKAFLKQLPMTYEMNRYADREYYVAINALPENGEVIDDYEDGDVTFYTAGSLAIYFAGQETSNQSGLIRMGKITSDLSVFNSFPDEVTVSISIASEGGQAMSDYDFSKFPNVEITGVDISSLNDEQLSVLYRQAMYCQAMTDADINTMRELVAEDVTFTHMSGRQQTREEYFADIKNKSLNYFTIGIENPVIEVDGNFASITYTSVLNANAYGARDTYRMSGTHRVEKIDGQWVSTTTEKE